jgi:hypothetical protein
MAPRSQRKLGLLLLAALLLTLSVLSLTACGSSSDEKTGLMEGEPVELGQLQWNVLFSRFLNHNDTEAREYLVGQPPPPPGYYYLGIFVQIINKDHDNTETLPDSLTVVDTQHHVYHAIDSSSIYALKLGSTVPPEDQVPAMDSTPQVGPINGSMILFKIPDPAAELRPLQLVIPGEDGPATVDLDL